MNFAIKLRKCYLNAIRKKKGNNYGKSKRYAKCWKKKVADIQKMRFYRNVDATRKIRLRQYKSIECFFFLFFFFFSSYKQLLETYTHCYVNESMNQLCKPSLYFTRSCSVEKLNTIKILSSIFFCSERETEDASDIHKKVNWPTATCQRNICIFSVKLKNVPRT